jgi:hypothetical protein
MAMWTCSLVAGEGRSVRRGEQLLADLRCVGGHPCANREVAKDEGLDALAHQMHQAEFAGVPGAFGHGMDALALLGRIGAGARERSTSSRPWWYWMRSPGSDVAIQSHSGGFGERLWPVRTADVRDWPPGGSARFGTAQRWDRRRSSNLRQWPRQKSCGRLIVFTGDRGIFLRRVWRRRSGRRLDAEHAQMHLQIGEAAVESGGRNAGRLAGAGRVLMLNEQGEQRSLLVVHPAEGVVEVPSA